MSTPEQVYATTAAWVRLAEQLDGLDDYGLGAMHEMVKHWRATLPGSAVMLVDVLDRLRDLGLAALADRKGATVEEIKTAIAEALVEGGHG